MAEQPLPDDREDFEQHPDVRGLAGPDVSPHLDDAPAARIELLGSSQELVELDNVPAGSELHIYSTDDDGNPVENTFVRTSEGGYGPNWTMQQPSPDSGSKQVSAALQGAQLGTSNLVRPGSVRRGVNFSYTISERVTGQSGADFPDDRPHLSHLPHVSTVDPAKVAESLKLGEMTHLPDGTLVWSVPASVQELTTGLVTDARVVIPEPPQAQQ